MFRRQRFWQMQTRYGAVLQDYLVKNLQDAPSLLERDMAYMPSKDRVPDAKPVRRSTRRSSMFVRNRPVEQQIEQT
jgi:hypothetical protein